MADDAVFDKQQAEQDVATEQEPGTRTQDQVDGGAFDSVRVADNSDNKARLPSGILIDPNNALPHLDKNLVQAFTAQDDYGGEYVALLAGRAAVPRITTIATYKNLRNPNIWALKDAGIVNWSPLGRQRLALVFQKPSGDLLLPNLDDDIVKLSEDILMKGLITPALSAFKEFRNLDIVHGSINPMNMFLSATAAEPSVIIGECLSSACSVAQHILFETIERGMAPNTGRGAGTIKDDLYAFGMCVAMLARGENIIRAYPEELMIKQKIEISSYGLVVGKERLPAGITEFLRGVLNDDVSERWDIMDAVKWLEGRRLSPSQPKKQLKAARPLIFKGRKYWYLRQLAQAFSENISDASEVIKSSQFQQWLKRNFDDKILHANFDMLMEAEAHSETSAAGMPLLVSKMCMALDAKAPLHYKGISVMPEGFGIALAKATAESDDIQSFAEIVKRNLFMTWANMQTDLTTGSVAVATQFEPCKGYLAQKIAGYGIERILYTMSNEAPCMSPLLTRFFISNPGGIAYALEQLASEGSCPEELLDRHMVSFISVRESKMVDPHLGLVVSSDPRFRVIGAARTLASIQKRFNTGPLPALGDWILAKMDRVVERIYNRTLRKEILQKLEALKGRGILDPIVDLVDDPYTLRKDLKQFNTARIKYYNLSKEKKSLTNKLKNRNKIGVGTGRQVALLVSAGISVLLILGVIVNHFTGILGF